MAPESAQQSDPGSVVSVEKTHPGDNDRTSDTTEDSLDDMEGSVV